VRGRGGEGPLAVFGGELVGFVVQRLGRCLVGDEQHAIAEGRGLSFLQGVVEGGLFGIEDTAAQRIGGEESVATRVPIGRVTRVQGVIENGEGDGMVVRVSGEGAPAASCAPDCAAFDPFAGEVDAGCIRGVRGDFGRAAACVEEDAPLLVRRFEPVGDTDAEDALLVVVEDRTVKGLERDDLIDNALMRTARTDRLCL
jgi:hypothetical protein